ncbi:TraC family protein [Brucella pituitosa]|uniref:TraC family protein n=1 Tax=Brucella pituitosa TaxID=571256 RepID=UPI0009A1559A|nr:TraC family protein [Brucella pituitosa]
MSRVRANKSVAEIQAEIHHLNAELEAAMNKQAQLIGQLALDAGLADLPLPDFKTAFSELARRFRADAHR